MLHVLHGEVWKTHRNWSILSKSSFETISLLNNWSNTSNNLWSLNNPERCLALIFIWLTFFSTLINRLKFHYFFKHLCQIKDKSIFNSICLNRSNSNIYFKRCVISLFLSPWTTFQTQTKYLQVSRTVALNGTNITITEVQKVLSSTSGLNMLGKDKECFNSKW